MLTTIFCLINVSGELVWPTLTWSTCLGYNQFGHKLTLGKLGLGTPCEPALSISTYVSLSTPMSTKLCLVSKSLSPNVCLWYKHMVGLRFNVSLGIHILNPTYLSWCNLISMAIDIPVVATDNMTKWMEVQALIRLSCLHLWVSNFDLAKKVFSFGPKPT